MTDNGKGDSPRQTQDQEAYAEAWDRIFDKKEKEGVDNDPETK